MTCHASSLAPLTKNNVLPVRIKSHRNHPLCFYRPCPWIRFYCSLGNNCDARKNPCERDNEVRLERKTSILPTPCKSQHCPIDQFRACVCACAIILASAKLLFLSGRTRPSWHYHHHNKRQFPLYFALMDS